MTPLTPSEKSKLGKNSRLRGRNLEGRVRRYLEESGNYASVIKTSGSHGPYDVLAIPKVLLMVPKTVFPPSKEIQSTAGSLVSIVDPLYARIEAKTQLIQVKSGQVYGKELEEYRQFAMTIPSYCSFQIWIIPKGEQVKNAIIQQLP